MSFKSFLEQKPLFYKEIDTNRVHIAFNILKPHIKHPKVIHIVGTNAKGSTGRTIAHLAYKEGLNVAHYTSPHILKFNERLWLNGKSVSDEVLEEAHTRLFKILGKSLSDKLSYFEYTTLLALLVFENCDLIVLEAGLGGEFDATNVALNRVLSVITPIGLDHQSFLGSTIKEIATTKLNSLREDTLALIANQPFSEVNKIAKEIAKKKGVKLYFAPKDIDSNLKEILDSKAYPAFLQENINLAIKALELIGIEANINNLKDLKLFGRFYRLKPNILIDVGHNPLASRAIYKALRGSVILIYNSLADKDYKEVLSILKPKIELVEIIEVKNQRVADTKELKRVLSELGISYRDFNGKIREDREYLVFGSFYTVQAFLESIKEDITIE